MDGYKPKDANKPIFTQKCNGCGVFIGFVQRKHVAFCKDPVCVLMRDRLVNEPAVLDMMLFLRREGLTYRRIGDIFSKTDDQTAIQMRNYNLRRTPRK
jgi:hypothetical protein